MTNEIGKFVSFEIDPDAEWHGGVVSFAQLAKESDSESPIWESELASTCLALCVSPETRMIHAIPDNGVEPLELLVRCLGEFADRHSPARRPARIGVTSRELCEALGELLQGTGSSTIFEPDSPFWNQIKQELCQQVGKGLQHATDAPALATVDCSEVQFFNFAEAAAQFYQARIWQFLDDTDLLEVETPKPPPHLKHLTILGAGRQEYGIGFYRSPQTHWDMRSQRLDLENTELSSFTYVPVNQASATDVALWQELDLPLAAGEAFPGFFHYFADEIKLPTPEEIEFLTVLLKALAATSENEIDQGRWTKQISIGDRRRKCKIASPDLLSPPDRMIWMDRGLLPERRSNERHFRLVQAVVDQNQGLDLDQLNELLNSRFVGSIDDFDYPSETAFDRAENLCFEAMDNYGRRRIQLARKAVEEDPTHVEANNLLAESAFDLDEKIERFERAVEFGRQQNEQFLQSEMGNFWGISQTRPFIRALYGLAMALESQGKRTEAIDHLLEILRLNTNDSLGARYRIVPLLLNQNREAEALEILERYREETASWLYLMGLVTFRKHGRNSRKSQISIEKALRFNPHVIELLSLDEPPLDPDHYQLQSPEEAAIVIEEQMESWLDAEGFIECLFKQYADLERQSAKRKRDRLRQQKRSKRRKSKPN